MSHTLKRKADESDDSDEEEPMLGRQVLPVANLPDTFDGVPMDGLQYLFTVRYAHYVLNFMCLPLRLPQPGCATASPCYSSSEPIRAAGRAWSVRYNASDRDGRRIVAQGCLAVRRMARHVLAAVQELS